MAVGTMFDLWAKPGPSVRIRHISSPSATRLRSAMMIACYHPGDSTLKTQSFELQIEHGLRICALTKGGPRSLGDLVVFRPDRDVFASTISSRRSGKAARHCPVTGLLRSSGFTESSSSHGKY